VVVVSIQQRNAFSFGGSAVSDQLSL
jgi:hypothetical protein